MIDPGHALSLTRQCELLELSRSSQYYESVPVSARDLLLMRRLDELICSSRSTARGGCAERCMMKASRSAGATYAR